MRDWTPEQWAVFFTAAGVFVGGLVTGIIAIINAAKAKAKSKEVETRVAAVEGRQDRQSDRMTAVEGRAALALLAAQPTPPQTPSSEAGGAG